MIDLNLYRKNIYTNSGVRPCPGYGEDGVLEKIFEVIGVSTFPLCVEFGELRVLGSTTRSYRIENFANAIYFSSSMDLRSWILNILDILKLFRNTGDHRVFKFFRSLPKRREINPENVVNTLRIQPNSIVDLFVVDIDSFDYDVVSEILRNGISPRVFIVEYNPNLPQNENMYVQYGQEQGLTTNKKFYGASYHAWLKMFTLFDYRLVHISGFCNLIFVRNDVDGDFAAPDILQEITDTDEKVLTFAAKFCLPGFVPSWLISPRLTPSERAFLRH